jgi:hypothetical protein
MNDHASTHPEETRVEAASPEEERADYVERLIRQRVPELSESEIAASAANSLASAYLRSTTDPAGDTGRFARTTGEDSGESANWRSGDAAPVEPVQPVIMMIPAEMAARLADVLEAFAERLDKIEDWIRVEGVA